MESPKNQRPEKKKESIPLKYRLIEASSEDPDHPLREINRGQKGNGWQSTRYCQYPQTIIIQFSQPVNLRQINVLIHEKNIPSQIKFFIYTPKSNDEYIKNYKHLAYEYAGYIKMDTNTRFNYRSREFRKVYVDLKCLYIKLELSRNYINRYNIFNQVGIISLNFFGNMLPLIGSKKNNQFYIDESVKPQNVTDEDLEEICGDKLNELKNQMEENIKEEKYEQCKIIKLKLERLRIIGKKIYDLEYQKRIAVNNEDFDTAKDLKELEDKMKVNLANVDNMYSNGSNSSTDPNSFDEQTVGPKGQQENIEVENNIPENIQEDNNLGNNTTINESMSNNKSVSKINSSSPGKQQKKFRLEEFLSHDDTIVPAVRKKINKETEDVIEEGGEADKGELEEIDKKILSNYAILVKYIEEEGVNKLFSKQILWKEEGFNLLLEKMPEMFASENDMNNLITILMKLVMLFLDEKHPTSVINTLDIVKILLDNIREHRTKLNIDLNITDSMLTKLKMKLGDVNPKIRNKTVELYSYMLTLDFCDYNNLISELIEEEIKHLDIKYIPKSSKLILGKLSILNSVFDDFQGAIESKRTDMQIFPSNLVSDYLIINVSHSKSEIRKLTRALIGKFIKIFGAKKIKKKLEKVENRELGKLVEEIPELQDMFPNLIKRNKGDSSIDMSNGDIKGGRSDSKGKRGNSKSREKSESPQRSSSPNIVKCNECQKEVSKDELSTHINNDCICFTKCEKCEENIEVKKYISHCITKCKFKAEWVKCKRCQEPILKEIFDAHTKENKCNPAKNPNSSNRCPLCHKDIPPNDKGFYTHLVKKGCPSQKRKF